MVQLSHVYKTFGSKKHVLKNVRLSLSKGDFCFLMGPSGAGKTTLFKLITGFEEPTSGTIKINNYRLDNINNRQIPYFRRTIGVVFQDFKLLNDRTVFENVALPLQILGHHRWDLIEKVETILQKVGLTKNRNDYPTYLSGGEKQRVAIARALVHNPKLLVADEPTGNLDWKLSEEIMDLFDDANQKGTTILIATHDKDIVEKRRNKKILVIENGTLTEFGAKPQCGTFFKPLNEVGLNIL